MYVKDVVLFHTRQCEPWSTSIKYWLPIPLFATSTLRDSLLLYVIRWGTTAVTLKSWSSWVWSWNSYLLSSSFHHVSRPNDFFFSPFSIVQNPKSRPPFSMSSEVSGGIKCLNNDNCRYWDFLFRRSPADMVKIRVSILGFGEIWTIENGKKKKSFGRETWWNEEERR